MQHMQRHALDQWLRNADGFYIESKVLKSYTNVLPSSPILMWYAFEQLIKVVILQDRFINEQSDTSTEMDLLQIDAWILKETRRYGHDAIKLTSQLNTLFPDLLTGKEIENIKELHNFFNTRYCDFKDSSIHINHNTLDSAFFKIRNRISDELSESIIDMLDKYRKQGKDIRKEYRLAFENNDHFLQRGSIKYKDIINFDIFGLLKA